MTRPGPHDKLDWRAAGTLAGLLALRAARCASKVAYLDCRNGAWRAHTWAAVAARAGRFQAALAAQRLAPGERVAVMLPNGLDWVCMDLAALALGLVVVPVYAADRPANAAYVLAHSGARALLVGDAAVWQALAAEAALPALERVVLARGAGVDARTVALADWLPATGAFEVQARDGAAPAAIVYTSGTTGRPKGVVLTHHAVLWNAHAAEERVPVYANDRLLSFLPLSHMLERTAGYYLPMLCGAEVAFARGIPELAQDLKTVRPTLLVSVPRIFERVERALDETRAGWPAPLRRAHARLLAAAAQAREHAQGHGPRPAGWPWLRPLAALAARPVRARLGGRLRLAICGGAPLRPETARLLSGVGMPLLQGYGLTESAPVLTVNPPHDNRIGSVGPPLPGVELRRTDSGELLARSPGLMQGYWQDAAATAAALDADGFLHTGDLAEVRDGYWTITGRLKDLLVLANGEKVAPADLEQALTADPLIAQALVLGDGRPYLAALLVLDRKQWAALAAELSLDPDDPAALADAGAQRVVLHRADTLLHTFPGYARVRRVHLSLEPWTVENDLLTSTLKPRRARILEHHAQAVAALYSGH